MQSVTSASVLGKVEGDFFFDYAIFTGAACEDVVRTLEAAYLAEPNDRISACFRSSCIERRTRRTKTSGRFFVLLLERPEVLTRRL